jgi:hypothetical protein
MASLDMLSTRSLLAKGKVGQVADDGVVLFTMRYIGSGAVTSVTVTTATDITTVTTEGTKAYTWAANTTIGALVDKINSDGIFEAKILDALSTTATGADLAIAGALTADSNGNYNVMSDTSEADFLAYRLTYDRTFGTNQKFRNGHRVHLQALVTSVTCGGGADTNALKIYSVLNGKETLVYQKTPTTGAAETITWANGQGKITASEGADLLVIVSDATSVTGSLTVTGLLE